MTGHGGGDQRARILRSVIEVVAERGYSRARIAEIATGAGVSRATFYEIFESREHCFVEALHEHARSGVRLIAAATTDAGAETAASSVLAALFALAQDEPQVFECLTHEATLAGPRALAERERFLAGLAEVMERVATQTGEARSAPDIPARMLLGAAIRTLGMSVRRGEPDFAQLLQELVAWSELYRTPARPRRWARIEADRALLRASSHRVAYDTFAPSGSPRGRHRLPAAVVRRIQRERILHGAASAISQKGYADTSVADIVTAAGLSRGVFYGHLHSRREALEQASRLFFEQSIAVMAGAYFTAPEPWPERVWTAGLALGELLVAAPAFTRLAVIEVYAPDPAAAQRADQLLLGFTVFFEQGVRERQLDVAAPSITPRAIVCALIETVFHFIVEERIVEIPGLLALATYVTLAPFTGVDFANDFVDRKLAELTSAG